MLSGVEGSDLGSGFVKLRGSGGIKSLLHVWCKVFLCIGVGGESACMEYVQG